MSSISYTHTHTTPPINNKMAVLTSRNNNDNAFEEHDDQTIKNDVRCCNNNDIRITTTNVRSNNNFKKRVSFHDSDLTTVHIVENLKRSLNRKERKQLWADHPSRKHIKIINKEIEDYESRLLMECFLFDNNSGSSNNSSKSICSNTSKPKRNRWYMKKKQ